MPSWSQASSRIADGAQLGTILPVLFVAYCIGLVAILANFRFIRIKEVETIFAAAYKDRHLFGAARENPTLVTTAAAANAAESVAEADSATAATMR